MPIPIQCPKCGHQAVVDDRMAGQAAPCAKCGNPVAVMGGPRPPGGPGGTTWAVITVVAVLVLCILVAVPAALALMFLG